MLYLVQGRTTHLKDEANMKEFPPFDDLVQMTDQEIQEFKDNYIEELLETSDSEDQKRRLRGLQFKIDMESRKAKTPLEACLKISGMMHESFERPKEALNDLSETMTGDDRGLSIIKETEIEDTELQKEIVSNVIELTLNRDPKNVP